MGRVLMVTRTVNYTTVKFSCANSETRKFEEHTVNLSGSLADKPEKLMKALKEELKDTKLGMPTIIEVTESSDLYGMTEKEFLSHAKKMKTRSEAAEEE